MLRVARAFGLRASTALWACVCVSAGCTIDWDRLEPVDATPSAGAAGGGGASDGGLGGLGGLGGSGGRMAVCGDGAVDGTEQCDDGGTTSNDGCSADCAVECDAIFEPTTFHCYVVLDELDATWRDARDACATLGVGFDLAGVSTTEEHSFLIAQPTVDVVLVPDITAAVLWLSGTDEASEDDWLWANGETPFFSAWVVDEPSNDGPTGEDCAVYIHRDGLTGYDDRPCDYLTAALCERSPAGR